MNSKTTPRSAARIACITLLTALFALLFSNTLGAQTPSKFMGTIATINGTTITVKTDQGETHPVEISTATTFKRIEPGQTNLASAATIQLSDLATGDRVLVRLDANAQVSQIIAIKQADVAQKQQKDREDWQQRGVGGLVKTVDTASGAVAITTGSGPTAKTVTIHTSAKTILKRYAPASVDYDAAKPAPITDIHTGDQLRARGTKNADGSEIEADEVVSGTFRNVSGTIIATNATDSSFTVKDLTTKKIVTVHVPADAQMHRLPDMMATMIAARLKSGGNTVSARPQQTGGAGGQGGARSGGGGDMQQMLSHLPTIKLTDLKKDDAVMLVSTDGSSDVTAITLLAGVEPLLEAPAAQNLLSNWSMGSGGEGGGQ